MGCGHGCSRALTSPERRSAWVTAAVARAPPHQLCLRATAPLHFSSLAPRLSPRPLPGTAYMRPLRLALCTDPEPTPCHDTNCGAVINL
ncbi:hypothetical protein AAFF_G00228460 [Aldrovandia affinis]|uniref:Uncharacterized protein n=1 Tax=Aldrovandia affinis TaxID=143900 RepID=A0AAD7SVH7_9TELE|nr:hypothetical protein AAFF_G00228460 [Aldrovandia affinis]